MCVQNKGSAVLSEASEDRSNEVADTRLVQKVGLEFSRLIEAHAAHIYRLIRL